MDSIDFESDEVKATNEQLFWEFIYKENQLITLEKAKKIVAFRNAITNNAAIKILVIIPERLSMTKDARDYLSSKEGTLNITHTAIVAKSKYIYFLSSFFVNLNPPQSPVKIFNKEEKAKEWLSNI